MTKSHAQYQLCPSVTLDASFKDKELAKVFDLVFANHIKQPQPNIDIYLTDSKPDFGRINFYGGKVNVSENSVYYSHGKLRAGIEFADNNSIYLDPIKKTLGFKERIRQLMLTGSSQPHLQEVFSYHGLWGLLHLHLLQKECSFVHAGCVVAPSEKSILIVGAGGSGKTSTSLSLIEKFGFRYQAEDFAIIAQSGKTYLSPRPLAIYHSDIAWGNSLLKNYYEEFTLSEKLFWKMALLKGYNPIRRGFVNDVFSSDELIAEADASNAYYIRRSESVDEVVLDTIGSEQLVEHLMGATLRELRVLYEPLMQAKAALGNHINPAINLEAVTAKTREVCKEALSNVICKRITAPKNCTPEQLAQFIAKDVL